MRWCRVAKGSTYDTNFFGMLREEWSARGTLPLIRRGGPLCRVVPSFTPKVKRSTLGPLNWPTGRRRTDMTIGTILLILVVLLLVGALPTWGHSRSWGYAPSGGLGLVLVVLLILLVIGKI